MQKYLSLHKIFAHPPKTLERGDLQIERMSIAYHESLGSMTFEAVGPEKNNAVAHFNWFSTVCY